MKKSKDTCLTGNKFQNVLRKIGLCLGVFKVRFSRIGIFPKRCEIALLACIVLFLNSSNVFAADVPEGFVDELVYATPHSDGGLSLPLGIEFLPSPDGRALAWDKLGRIIIFDPEGNPNDATEYMLIPPSDISTSGEAGLLDLVLDPDFSPIVPPPPGKNNFFYVYYMREPEPPHNIELFRISRFVHQGDTGDYASETVIWINTDPADEPSIGEDTRNHFNHCGGGLDFASDGSLYLAIGDSDATDGGNPFSQRSDLNAGKVVRIHPVEPNATATIVASGLRNPFKAAFDDSTQRFFIADVGGNVHSRAVEEINLNSASLQGVNYGWPSCEGTTCNPPLSPHEGPVHGYDHLGDSASITGGVVYRGDTFPEVYSGVYFYGDFARGWLRYLEFASDDNTVVVSDTEFSPNIGSVLHIEQSPTGDLYYMTLGETDEIRRIRFVGGTSNTPPTITISSPDNNATFVEGGTIVLSGTANDTEDGRLTDEIEWTSNRDGFLGSGGNVTVGGLSLGAHTITAMVSDSTGSATTEHISIAIVENTGSGDHTELGSGTVGDPYLLFTADQMVSLSNTPADWNKHYLQMGNIDLAGHNQDTMSTLGTQAIPFSGTFDGGGHTISNFTYISPSTDFVGFFGHVRGSAAEIRNVRLDDVDVIGRRRTGSLVGSIEFASIVNSSAKGEVNGLRYVGGLVGYCQNGAIVSSSSSEATVMGNDSHIGGLVGSTSRFCRLINSYATGTVSGTEQIGGLVGRSGLAQVTWGCYATGSVIGAGADVGGLIGHAQTYSKIADSFATGDVMCDDAGSRCGALIGSESSTTISTNVHFNSTALCDTRSQVPCNVIGNGVDLDANPDYFFVASNEPLSSMDFANVWSSVEDDYPALAPTFLDIAAWGDCSSHGSDAPFAGGVGSLENPYLICTATQLQEIGATSGTLQANYALMSDVDLSGFTGASFAVIGNSTIPFSGTFRGNGNSLKNFIYSDTAHEIGVFGRAEQTLFSRVGIANADVVGTTSVGALLGHGLHTHVVDSFVTGRVSGNLNVGGLVGAGAYVNNSYSLATVVGTKRVGGLIGVTTVVADSFSVGSVTGSTGVGPVVGQTGSSTVNCYFALVEGCDGCSSFKNVEVAEPSWFFDSSNPPFAGAWDFSNTWRSNPNGYPSLIR